MRIRLLDERLTKLPPSETGAAFPVGEGPNVDGQLRSSLATIRVADARSLSTGCCRGRESRLLRMVHRRNILGGDFIFLRGRRFRSRLG